jgi:integrase
VNLTKRSPCGTEFVLTFGASLLTLYSFDVREELARVKAVTINTGLRARELVNTWWTDIDFEKATIRGSEKPDWKPKDYEERVIHLNKAALQALRDQKLQRGVLGQHVFCRQDGKKYGRGLGSLCGGRLFGPGLNPVGCTRCGIPRNALPAKGRQLGGSKRLAWSFGHKDNAALSSRRQRGAAQDD